MIPRLARLAPRAHLVLATVAISTLLPATSAVAASRDHPSTGGGTAGPASVLPRSLVAEAADHARIAGSVRTQLDAGLGTPSRPGTTGCSRLGRKFSTCAAAAVRNMTSTLTGRDRGELHFEQSLRIRKSQGLLGIAHIPRVLNAEYATYPAWTVVRPSSAAAYLAHVVTDVRVFGRGVIQNVHTAKLSFFRRAGLTHYDLVYGYDTRAKTIDIAEEWNPAWTFGGLPRAYHLRNPYGLHPGIAASEAYAAVKASPNRAVVI